MCDRRILPMLLPTACLLLAAATPARGLVLDEATTAYNRGDFDTTIALLTKEVETNPGHEAAYVLLARAFEGKHEYPKAQAAWTKLQRITRDDPTRAMATRSLLRIRAQERGAHVSKDQRREDDPFNVPGIHDWIDYRGLEIVDDANYTPTEINGDIMNAPPIPYETRHFMVYTCNEKLSRIVGELCEKYLAHLMKRIIDERAWAFRVPVLVYKDIEDYWNVGGAPRGSAGVTASDHIGRSRIVMLYQNSDEDDQKYRYSTNPVMGNIEDVLPHELTHVVINEFFGAQKIPRWLHEAFARQMEQNRPDYKEAATLARDAVAGEYFRFRDLFAAENYPSAGRTHRFYEQSATIVLYLLEHGPEATRAFLNELAHQRGHDAAAAAAFGIPEEGAVEEFERRWVEWMRQRYARDLERGGEETGRDTLAAAISDDTLLLPAVDEPASADKVKKWRTIDLTSKKSFVGVGDSLEDWEISGDTIRCNPSRRRGATFLGIHMIAERVPMAVRCKLRWLSDQSPNSDVGWFGFVPLNADNLDIGAQCLLKLDSGSQHEALCVVGDDVAVFLDGKCAGRFPAPRQRPTDPDIDYPIALVSHSPVEVTELEVCALQPRDFVRREPPGEGETEPGDAPPSDPPPADGSDSGTPLPKGGSVDN